MRNDSAEILSQSSLQKAIEDSSNMGKDVHSLTLTIQHFLCRPRRPLPSEDALVDGFTKAVMARDMPEPCEFQSLASRQKSDLGE